MALDDAQRDHPGIGDSWVLPDPADPTKPVSRHLLWRWWDIGETVAGIEHVEGLGYHSLRRKFATELKHTPLRDLCELGGWKDPQTILKCYQRPDDATMRAALAGRRRLASTGGRTDTMDRHHAAR